MPQEVSSPGETALDSSTASAATDATTVIAAAASRLSLGSSSNAQSKDSSGDSSSVLPPVGGGVDARPMSRGSSASGMSGERRDHNVVGSTTAFDQPVQTKVFYYIDDEQTPYKTIVDVPPEHITLEDFKRVLNRHNFKYYCKTVDKDCATEVKQEMLNDGQVLQRARNGNFELYLITTEGSSHSDSSSALRAGAGGPRHYNVPGPAPPVSFGGYRSYGGHHFDSTMSTESDSMVSGPLTTGFHHRTGGGAHHVGGGAGAGGHYGDYRSRLPPGGQHYGMSAINGHRGRRYEDSTLGSESDARLASDDDDRGSISTDLTSVSRQHERMVRRRRQAPRQHRRPSRASSFSSITESSMSLHVQTVTLNMDTVNFLGISIVGQSSASGDNGIYVANVMKGGAVALDGRIDPGDMILQVNDIAFDNFTNDQAVDVLREAVERKGPIRLTVAKSLDQSRGGSCFTIPYHYNHRDEPVRPIDTGAWIQHTNAMRGMPSILEGSEGAPTPLPGDGRGMLPGGSHAHHAQAQRPASSSTATSTGSNGQNTVVGQTLGQNSEPRAIIEAMLRQNSGLDIKNRTWLKISIPMSFLGSDLVEWLLDHIDGLRERKDARRFASRLLKTGAIAHVVNKITFTEQCYYVVGEQYADVTRHRALMDEQQAAAVLSGQGVVTGATVLGGTGQPFQWTVGAASAAAAANNKATAPSMVSHHHLPPHLQGGGMRAPPPPPSADPYGIPEFYLVNI